jgi:ribosomal 50S subunit-recycling heat shock protein
MVEHGKVRLNGRKLRKPSALLRITDVITLTRGDSVIVVKVLSLPLQRGSAKNSADWYANI